MQHFVRGSLLTVALGTALAVASVAPAAAQIARPQSIAAVNAGNLVTQVQWRGRGYRRGYGGAGLGVGLATGLIVGGAIAAQSRPYYAAPVYAAPPDEVGYCMQRFKSYDPASGTYLGYDGMRHPCP
jgi:hypothetical protein